MVSRIAVELQVVKASDNYKAVGIMAVEGEPGLTGYTENQGFAYINSGDMSKRLPDCGPTLDPAR